MMSVPIDPISSNKAPKDSTPYVITNFADLSVRKIYYYSTTRIHLNLKRLGFQTFEYLSSNQNLDFRMHLYCCTF